MSYRPRLPLLCSGKVRIVPNPCCFDTALILCRYMDGNARKHISWGTQVAPTKEQAWYREIGEAEWHAVKEVLVETGEVQWAEDDREMRPVARIADVPEFRVRLGREETGRLAIVGLVVGKPDGSKEITARALREIPFTTVLNFLRTGSSEPLTDVVRQQAIVAATELSKVERRPGQKGHSPEHWRRVADLYHAGCRVRPEAPVQYMAETLGDDRPSMNTLYKWVSRARALGHINGREDGD